MKTFYKTICEDCGNVLDKSTTEIEHIHIPSTFGKRCECGSVNLKIWRSRG